MTTETQPLPMDNVDFDALDAILDDLRTRGEDVPQWEFCEGAIAALLCTRRLVLPDEFLPLLLGTGDSQPEIARSFRCVTMAASSEATTGRKRSRAVSSWARRVMGCLRPAS